MRGQGLENGSDFWDLDRKTGTLHVLVHLYRRGPATKTSIYRDLGHPHETIAGTLRVLDRLGLIISEQETWFPHRETFYLSVRGKELVETPLHLWPHLLMKKIG